MARFFSSCRLALAALALIVACSISACSKPDSVSPAGAGLAPLRPSILLVTLDTTRADAIGPEARRRRDARVQRAGGARAAVPAGVRDRAGDAAVAQLDDDRPVSGRARRPRERALPARRRAPCSPSGCGRPAIGRPRSSPSFVLARRFGLARGFDRLRRRARRQGERRARRRETTDRGARASARRPAAKPLFLWVHYFDPHTPYAPPEPFRARYANAVSRRSRGDGRAARPARPGVRAARRAARRSRSSSSPITARGSAITARRSMAICSISRRCTCRWCWSGPGVDAGVDDTPVSTRRDLPHACSTGRALDARTEPARASRAPGGRARRGDEAVPRIRLAAADHGGRGPAQGDPRGQARGLRRGRRSGETRRSRRGATLSPRTAQGAATTIPCRRRTPRAPRRHARRRGAAAAGEPRLRQRERRAGRPQGRAAAGGHGRAASSCSNRRRRCSCSEQYARGDPAARADPRRGSEQPRRGAAAGDRALVARPGRAGASAAFRRAAAIAPRSARRAHLSRAALRARQGWPRAAPLLERIVARRRIACRRSKRWPRAREAGPDRGRGRAAPAGLLRCRTPSAAEWVRLGELAMPAQQTPRRDRRRSSARARCSPRRSRTISSWACCTSRRGDSRTRARRSIACPPRIPTTRWRCSSARRSACC